MKALTSMIAILALCACGPTAVGGDGGGSNGDGGGAFPDNDRDGYDNRTDCNDNDPTIYPGAWEDCDDGIDNNCNDIIDTDCLTPCDIAAMDRSSVGCVFYPVDTNPIHSGIAGDYAITVSNVANIDLTGTANVVVEVKIGGVWSVVPGGAFVVPALALHTLVLPHRFVAGSTIFIGGAYRVTSDLPVVVYQFNPLDGSASFLSDASMLLPAAALDTLYIVPAWPFGNADNGNNWPAHIQIAASATTSVTVTPTVATLAGGVQALTPNVPATFDLEEGDYLQLTVATFNGSLIGTSVESTEPVAVFTSNDCVNVPLANCCCEHLEEQIFGLQTWGKSYVASAIKRSTEPAVWQIIAQNDNTVINFDFTAGTSGLPATVTLNAGRFIEYTVNGPGSGPGDFLITADQPILVTQYMVAGGFAGGVGDPSMVQAVPSEQYLQQYVVLVPNTWLTDVLVLTRVLGSTVQVDGNVVTSGWTRVGASNFEVNRLIVPDGVHSISGTSPVGVIIAGYDSYDSYAYPGGLNQELINIPQ